MNKREHYLQCSSEEYGYISGLFKVREINLFTISEYDTLLNFTNLSEALKFISTKNYSINENMKDGLEIEDNLWNKYYRELSEVKKFLPEKYLIYYLKSLQQIIYKKENKKDKPQKHETEFREELNTFYDLSSNGTSYTKEIADYILDKYNLSEYIRSMIFKSERNIEFYKEGKLSIDSISELFRSTNTFIPDQLNNTYWYDFFKMNYPIVKIDFNYLYDLEKYWFNVFNSLSTYPENQPYGFDFVLSYFLRLIFEIIKLNKIILSLMYDLPQGMILENLINA